MKNKEFVKQRRNILKGLSAGLVLSQVPSFLFGASNSPDYFLICDDSGEPQIYNQTEFVKATPGFLKLWQFGTETEEIFDLPFAGHSMTQNPKRPTEVAVFSRWGDQVAIVNLKEKNNIRIIKEDKDHRFFGHGIYSNDGNRLYTSQSNDTNHTGEIVVRDSKTFKILNRFSAFGRYPYELQFNSSSTELIVAVSCAFKDADYARIPNAHYAEESSLTSINATNGNFVKRVKLDREHSLIHFQTSADGWTVGVGQANERDTSEKRSYAISISPGGKVKEMNIPDDFKGYFYGEAIGIVLLEKKSLAYITNRSTKLILIWNYKTQELIKYFYIPDRPKAIAMTSDQKQIIVSETKTKSFILIDSFKMEINGRAKGKELSGFGAHVLRLKNF